MTEDPALVRIEAALASLGDDRKPPAGWQERVLDAVRTANDDATAATATAPGARWRQMFAPAMGAALVLALLVIWLVTRPRPAQPTQLSRADVSLSLSVTATGTERGERYRGEPLSKDRPILVAAEHGGDFASLWIFDKQGTLIAACPGHRGCAGSSGRLRLTLVPDAVGELRVVAVASQRPIPAPTGTRDEAKAAALSAGATCKEESLSIY